MKRRLISLLILTCMLVGIMLSASSCFVRDMRINNALKKTNKLTDVDAYMTMSITIGEQTQKMSFDIKADGEDEDELIGEIIMRANGSSQVMYLDKDYVYVSDGNGSGYKVDADEFGTSADEDMESLLQKLPNEAFDDAEYKKGKNGKLTMTTELDDEVFEETFAEFIKSTEDAIKESLSDAKNFSYDDCEISITIQKGYVIEFDIEFEFSLEVNGTEYDVFVHVNTEINNPGEDVTVKLPKGCSNWEKYEN